MEDKIKARKTDELQTQFIKLTDEFIAALDTGTPFSQLQSLRDKIRLLSKVLDARKLSGHWFKLLLKNMRNVAFVIIALLFIIICIINGVDSILKVTINLLIAVGIVALLGALMGSKD